MKRLTLLLTTVAIAVPMSFAQAADIDVASTYDWSGMYAGVQAGYGWGDGNNTLAAGLSDDFGDFVGGVHLGWNHQSSQIVFGIESDFEFTGLNADFSAGSNTAELDMDFMGSLRGRLGFAADNLLFYTTAGLAIGSSDYRISNGVTVENFSDSPLGYAVGAGLEYAFSETLTTRIEYRYTDLGKEVFPSTLFPGDTFTANYDFHTVRAGLSWKF